MSAFKSDFLRVLEERGFIHQISDPEGLDALAAKGEAIGYVGYDCTAPSLHIGNFLTMMMLYWLQQTGNKPITLVGGGTTMVGDPSGKDESRPLRTVEEIEANKASIRSVFSKVLRFGTGKSDAIMVDNADWLLRLGYIEMLRDVGRHFSVNRMLTMDSVRLRLEREHEMSFIEFNYMVCQSYDFVELARRYGCNLQMGGSDQWGNIVNGVELGRRMGTHQLLALTTPLLTTASGAKMGKTAQGAVWLNADQFSPYNFWQYWRNVEDADVIKFLKLFTILPMSEIERLAALGGSEINEAKKILATEATTLLHGREEAEKAAETARKTFEEGVTTAALPTETIERAGYQYGRSTAVIARESKLVSSTSEARRKIAEGALRINDRLITDPNEIIPWSELYENTGAFKVQLGKKKVVLLRPQEETTDSPPIMTIDKGPNGEWQYGRSAAAIVAASGLASSRVEAARRIAEGTVQINGELITNPDKKFRWTDVDKSTGAFRVQRGQQIVLVRPA
jgi:tyrosyl-tRNA synthetase